MKGDRAALGTLLQQKANVNAPQTDGVTALHWAIYKNDLGRQGRQCAARILRGMAPSTAAPASATRKHADTRLLIDGAAGQAGRPVLLHDRFRDALILVLVDNPHRDGHFTRLSIDQRPVVVLHRIGQTRRRFDH